MFKKSIILSSLAFAAAALLTACASTGPTGAGKKTETIKIGWLSPLTGDVSAVGQAMKDTVVLAVKELNAKGGIKGRKIEVIYEDGACEAKTASNAGQKLINADKVIAIIGGACSGETLAVAPTAEQNKVVMISPASTAPSVSSAGDYIFRVVPSDAYQGKFAAEFVYNTLSKRKAAVLYAVTDYTKGLADAFSAEFVKLGGKVAAKDTFLQTSRDLKSQLTKIKKSGADVLYFPTYTEAGIIGFKQTRELGLKMQIVGTDSYADPKLFSSPDAEGVIYLVPFSEESAEFKAKFLKAAKRSDMPIYVTQSYDAINLLAMVMKKAGLNSEAIKNELYKIKDYKGVSGTINFDANGDLSSAKYEVRTVKGGKETKFQ